MHYLDAVDARLGFAPHVAAYVRRHKSDRTDAEALVEATRSGAIPTVAVQTVGQQEILAFHRLRQQRMTTRTARINALRGLLREQGIMLTLGARTAMSAIPRPLEDGRSPSAESAPRDGGELIYPGARGLDADRRTATCQRRDPRHRDTTLAGSARRRALTPPRSWGVSGMFMRSAVGDSGWRQHLGAIAKQRDVYLRYFVTHGARCVVGVLVSLLMEETETSDGQRIS